jgi:hypothetical protein
MNEYKVKLIEMVHNQPALWNQKSEAYHKTKHKEQIWQQIASALNDDGKSNLLVHALCAR